MKRLIILISIAFISLVSSAQKNDVTTDKLRVKISFTYKDSTITAFYSGTIPDIEKVIDLIYEYGGNIVELNDSVVFDTMRIRDYKIYQKSPSNVLHFKYGNNSAFTIYAEADQAQIGNESGSSYISIDNNGATFHTTAANMKFDGNILRVGLDTLARLNDVRSMIDSIDIESNATINLSSVTNNALLVESGDSVGAINNIGHATRYGEDWINFRNGVKEGTWPYVGFGRGQLGYQDAGVLKIKCASGHHIKVIGRTDFFFDTLSSITNYTSIQGGDVYLKKLARLTNGWIGIDGQGKLFSDSIAPASAALNSTIPLFHQFFFTRENSELHWPVSDGDTVTFKTMSDSPADAFNQLWGGVELNYRYDNRFRLVSMALFIVNFILLVLLYFRKRC